MNTPTTHKILLFAFILTFLTAFGIFIAIAFKPEHQTLLLRGVFCLIGVYEIFSGIWLRLYGIFIPVNILGFYRGRSGPGAGFLTNSQAYIIKNRDGEKHTQFVHKATRNIKFGSIFKIIIGLVMILLAIFVKQPA